MIRWSVEALSFLKCEALQETSQPTGQARKTEIFKGTPDWLHNDTEIPEY